MSSALNEVALTEPEGGWLLEDEDVPETPLHDAIIELLLLVLRHHARDADALIARNLGCRWNPNDARVGTDPDIVWVEPAPPEGEDLATLRSWLHPAPRIAVEIVSDQNPEKDYVEAPPRCGRLGVRELWIFDPKRVGPRFHGGPFALQVWRLVDDPNVQPPEMTRIYAGDGPAFSPELGAWLVVTDEGRRLRIAKDPAGTELWPTAADEERRRADEERLRADEERLRADEERLRADEERLRADEVGQRADALAARLRALGVDPDGV